MSTSLTMMGESIARSLTLEFSCTREHPGCVTIRFRADEKDGIRMADTAFIHLSDREARELVAVIQAQLPAEQIAEAA